MFISNALAIACLNGEHTFLPASAVHPYILVTSGLQYAAYLLLLHSPRTSHFVWYSFP